MLQVRSRTSFGAVCLASLFTVLAACSGGGGGGGAPAPSAPPPSGGGGSGGGPTWTPGVFAAASTYKDRCENPRQGVDIEGNAFPDRSGSTTLENFWLRSWTNETYLWNDEVTDRNPANYSDTLTYFDLLKTTAIEPSGAPRDDFHFSQPTEEFLEQRNSAPTASYGVSYAFFASAPPRDIRVRYTDPNTPASEVVNGLVQFPRGARILTVDGVDVRNGSDVDTLNDGLFPPTAGETHTFTIEEVDGTVRDVTLVSENLSRQPVAVTRVIPTATGDVGYILFNTFSPFQSEEDIVLAMQDFQDAGVTDLVLDLRYNGGGLLAVASQLSYMVAGPAFTSGKTFEQLRFNDDAGNFNPVTGQRNDPIPFYDETLGFTLNAGQPLPRLDLPRVFILSTANTCSASEAVINGLRGINFEVVLIGDITCGKPYGFYPQDNCGTTYYTIQFQGTNDRGFGDYADGFVPSDNSFQFGVEVPGCTVADDLSSPLGDENEAMLAAALTYRSTGSCPTATTSTAFSTASAKTIAKPAYGEDDTQAIRPPIDIPANNRDMRLPGDL